MIKRFNQYIKEQIDFEDDDMEYEYEEDESLEDTGAKVGDRVICIRDTSAKFSKYRNVIKKGDIKKVAGGTVTMINFPVKVSYYTVWFKEGEGAYPGKDFRLI